MSVITNLLDALSAAREELYCKEQEIICQVPQHLLEEKSSLEAQVKSLETQVKAKAKYIPETQAHTLKGLILQLVWNQPKPKLDEEKVRDLLARYNVLVQVSQPGTTCPEMTWDDLTVKPDGYWSIRNRA